VENDEHSNFQTSGKRYVNKEAPKDISTQTLMFFLTVHEFILRTYYIVIAVCAQPTEKFERLA
jgi:hypothetical protein